jgi:Domain of unknown function (DUF4296)
MRTLVLFCTCFILFSCGSKNSIPSGIIKPEKMQLVLWDIMRADALAAERVKKDSNKNTSRQNTLLQKNIFAYYEISREKYTRSIEFYKSHPSIMRVLLDSLTLKVQKERPEIYHTEPQKLDSIIPLPPWKTDKNEKSIY